MSAHVLLNLLNKLRKRDKMRGLQSILSLFCNKCNKFNNTRAQMLESNIKITLKSHFWHKKVICHYVRSVVMDIITFPEHLLYRFYCMALFHSQTQHHMIITCITEEFTGAVVRMVTLYSWARNCGTLSFMSVREICTVAKPILPPLSVAATGTVYKDCFSLSRTWLENISPET